MWLGGMADTIPLRVGAKIVLYGIGFGAFFSDVGTTYSI